MKKEDKVQVDREASSAMPLVKANFIWMTIAGALIVLGFCLIAGGGSGIEEYNPDIFSTRRIVVGPMLSFIGFVLMGVSIIIKPKTHKK